MRLGSLLLGTLLLVACAAPLPVPGISYDLSCHVVVDAVSATSTTTTQTCTLVSTPTPTPVPHVTTIQFADPDPTATTCGHLDVQDAWLAEVQPNVSWGHCWSLPAATFKLYIGNLSYIPPGAAGNEYRTVIKFTDLSAIPVNATVDSAILTIKQTHCQAAYADGSIPAGCSGATFTIEAHQVRTPWAEDSVRWMDMPGFDAAALSTATVSNTLGATLNLDVTQAFREWLTKTGYNNGVILIANPLPVNDFFRGRSHDTVCDASGCSYGQGSPPGPDAPKLTVTWR